MRLKRQRDLSLFIQNSSLALDILYNIYILHITTYISSKILSQISVYLYCNTFNTYWNFLMMIKCYT